MEFFPIAAIVIATFLLLIGIVGRGASMGSSQFHITLEGNIGRLPRVAILAVSVVTYMLAIFGFVYVAESKSSSESSSPTTVVTTIEDQNSVIEVNIESSLGDGTTAEHDEITLAGVGPLILDMNTDSRDATGSFELNSSLSGLEVDYSVKIVVTLPDGTEDEFHGKGKVVVEDNRSLIVSVDENRVVTLE
ncbi:hypothetical protein EAO71_00565 [Streptomyces sp. ms191]|uniref:hypothetical protein n=1 Tax=Streptomyces sp. ms191 TaxID=1827978 RepID=UPI0011CDB6A1|nr:hypothetical protein [Streptomyces sp. ms191]TXS34558.1 hypothetical protein EAO71_00565 [Streptomyces sp. ms191]